MSTRMTRGSEPGTSTSRAHSSGTELKPILRAATAGNSASRSSVSVKMQLTASSGRSALRSRISSISDSVAPRMASASLASTVVAPRRANRRMGAHHASRRLQGPDLGGLEPPRLPLLEPPELERPEAHAPQRQHAVADGFAHPLDLAFAPLVDRQLEHAGTDLTHLRRSSLPLVELDALPQALERPVLDEAAVNLRDVGPWDLMARVHQPVGELAVVGEQDQPGRVGVEPPDRVEP